jgi:hypothetical protein
MEIPGDDLPRFDELDEQRRRVVDEFNLLVINMRGGSVRNQDRAKMEAQHLHMRHNAIIREMIDLLV